jgi:hypothetical protein
MGASAGSRERPGRYLLGSSALSRILRDGALRAAWAEVVTVGATAARYLPDLRERAIRDVPPTD